MANEKIHAFKFISVGEKINDSKQQYFLVNDDGALVSSIDLQHVTEVQDAALSNIQQCTIYDVTQQQYYVDANGTELVPGELIIHDDSNDEVFSSNYLLQKDNESNIQVIDQMDIDEENPLAAEIHLFEPNTGKHDMKNSTGENSEVTLTDEQCRLLEDKGRVMLEFDEKVYLLDPYGIRDITHDSELIESVTDEMFESSTYNNEIITLEPDSDNKEFAPVPSDSEHLAQCHLINRVTVLDPSEPTHKSVPMESEIIEDERKAHNNIMTNHSLEKPKFLNKQISSRNNLGIAKYDKITLMPTLTQCKENGTLQGETVKSLPEIPIQSLDINSNIHPELRLPPLQLPIKKREKPMEKKIIRLNANCHVEDIPQKNFIGYSANGKKLFAKVVDIKCSDTKVKKLKVVRPESSIKLSSADQTEASSTSVPATVLRKERTEHTKPGKNIDETKPLPQEIARQLDQGHWIASSDAAEISMAEHTVASLLNLPAVKPHLIGKHLLHTKTIHKTDASGKEVRVICEFVEGRVVQNKKREGGWMFVSAPFSEFAKIENREAEGVNEKMKVRGRNNAAPQWMVHLHVTETLRDSQGSDSSVTLYRRSFPLGKSEKKGSVHVCSECAEMFQSEIQLENHQTLHQLESKTIKTKENDINDLNEFYCPYCKKSCKNGSHRVRHMETHITAVRQNHRSNTPFESISSIKAVSTAHTLGGFICKICSCSYIHSSSLTKHIKKHHITKRL